MQSPPDLSVIHAPPLADEPGIGALTIPGYLREVTRRYADREAVILNTGGDRLSWTYAELWQQAEGVARALVACGLGKGARVGILMTNRPEFLSSLFGVGMAGGVAVALSTFSTPDELAHLLESADLTVLLFEPRVLKKDFARMLADIEPALETASPETFVSKRLPFLRHIAAVDDLEGGGAAPPSGAVESWTDFLERGAAIPAAVVEARLARIQPADPGGIFFSSGTTSLPKGIVHAQRAFAVQWWRWPRVFCMHEPVNSWTGNGFFWSGNVSMVVGTAFSTGGAVILQRYFDASEALRLIEAERVTFLNGRPHQWARLQEAPNWPSADLSSLRYVTRGELVTEHPSVDTDWRLPMSFGTTETMTICTAFTADTSEDDYAGSFGAPLPGNTLKIVDPLTHLPVPIGQSGEMCIKGPTLLSHYLGKSPEECLDAEGFYCTGDGGHIDATGRFYFEGRLNDIIKTGGANVAPDEVDGLLATHPGVQRCQTVGVPDTLLGEMVVSCIVPLEGASIDVEALLVHLKTRLASFKVPRRILLFRGDELEVTGSGKVKTAALRGLAQARMAAEAADRGGSSLK